MILKINNKKFDFFNDVDVTMAYDSIASTFGFKALFEPNNSDHKNLFRPLRYSKVEVIHGDELILTGRKISSAFKSSAKKTAATLSGYSLSGVLADCTIPLEAYPIQSDGLTLREIAEKMLKPFDLALVVNSAVEDRVDSVFDTTQAKSEQSVQQYLVSLAAQKSIIVTHTPQGALYFTEAKANLKPTIDLSDAVDKQLKVNGQGVHSSIAVLKDADMLGGNAGQFELDNPLVDSFRPKIAIQSSGNDDDTELAAKIIRSAELKAISLQITLPSWTIDGKIVRPNMVISVKDPELWLYETTNFFVERVSLKGNEKSQTAVLNCVLPETYTLETPNNPFS